MLDVRYSHLYFYQSLNRLQRGLSAIAELLVISITVRNRRHMGSYSFYQYVTKYASHIIGRTTATYNLIPIAVKYAVCNNTKISIFPQEYDFVIRLDSSTTITIIIKTHDDFKNNNIMIAMCKRWASNNRAELPGIVSED